MTIQATLTEKKLSTYYFLTIRKSITVPVKAGMPRLRVTLLAQKRRTFRQ